MKNTYVVVIFFFFYFNIDANAAILIVSAVDQSTSICSYLLHLQLVQESL